MSSPSTTANAEDTKPCLNFLLLKFDPTTMPDLYTLPPLLCEKGGGKTVLFIDLLPPALFSNNQKTFSAVCVALHRFDLPVLLTLHICSELLKSLLLVSKKKQWANCWAVAKKIKQRA